MHDGTPARRNQNAPKQGRFTQAAREERKALQRLLRQQRKLLQVIE